MDVFWLGRFVVVSLQSPVDSHFLLLHLSIFAGFGLSKQIHCSSHLYWFVVGLLGWVVGGVAVSLGRFVVVIFGFFVVILLNHHYLNSLFHSLSLRILVHL